MKFSITEDKVLYLYHYYSYKEKNDENSKKVYHVFKKGWGMETYFPEIASDLLQAIEDYIFQNHMENLKIAVAVMPSHSKGMYGDSLLKIAKIISTRFGWFNASRLIWRKEDKVKSTEGGVRTVEAHLYTLDLGMPIDNSIDVYIIMDDITTTGSSLEAAKQLLIYNGISRSKIIKIAIAKTASE